MAYTRAQFAEEKGIRLATLEVLRIYDGKTGVPGDDGTTHFVPCVKIPYLTPNGTEYRPRVRWNGGKDGHKWGGKQGKASIPYGLERPIPFVDHVWIVEGETDRMALYEAGEPALGIPGASNWKCLFAKYLTPAKTAYVVQEPGDAGENFPKKIAERLYADGFAGKCVAVQMPDDIKDPRELLQSRGGDIDAFKAKLQEAVVSARAIERPDPSLFVASAAEGGDEGRGPSQIDKLIALIDECGIELFKDEELGEGYARVPLPSGAKGLFRVRSRDMRSFLTNEYFQRMKTGTRSQSMSDAINTVEARAVHGSRSIKVHLRVAHEEGTIHLDLGDAAWNEVQITASAWKVCPHQVHFRRSPGMGQLPTPTHGGKLDALRPYLNLVGEEHDGAWALIASYLVASIATQGPYPLLALIAEQGAGKTEKAKMLRSLLDPSAFPTVGTPRNDNRDLLIAAKASHVIVLDNLSRIDAQLSDLLCCISTGTSHRVRSLYTDEDETIFRVQRPIIITAISDVVTRGDLLDRTILVPLSAIPEDQRLDVDELKADFEPKKPAILGALCDAAQVVLAGRDVTRKKMTYKPRMLDYAIAAVATEPLYGINDRTGKPRVGVWEEAHRTMRADAHAAFLQARFPSAVTALMSQRTTWEGTAAELLSALEQVAGLEHVVPKPTGWPADATRLSGAMRRAEPALRSIGIVVDRRKDGRGAAKRTILVITRTPGDDEDNVRKTPALSGVGKLATPATTATPPALNQVFLSVANGKPSDPHSDPSRPNEHVAPESEPIDNRDECELADDRKHVFEGGKL